MSKEQALINICTEAHSIMSVRGNRGYDIFEHLPTLRKYASVCDTVLEAGVRSCVSSYPLFLGLISNDNGKKKGMISIDLEKSEEVKRFEANAKKIINFEFFTGSDLDYEIKEKVDLLFIDTFHVRGQLKRELAKYSSYVNKYIIMHDTTVDEYVGESIRLGWDVEKQSRELGWDISDVIVGLWPAVTDFIKDNKDWVLRERFTNNNGLTILERVNNVKIIKESDENLSGEEKIILAMKSCCCNKINFVVYGKNDVFAEITKTLQLQIIDRGVFCEIKFGEMELTNDPDIFYILFNSHNIPMPFFHSIKYAVFNYEQAGSPYVQYPSYIQKINSGVVLFDYSVYNKEILRHLVNKEIIIAPFTYHKNLTILDENKSNDETTDILFYGADHPNRQKYIQLLRNAGLNVKYDSGYSLFGENLYKELRDAKIVLNLHYYCKPSILEISRIVPLIANYKLVLSETSDDKIADEKFKDMVVYINEENIVSTCKKYLESPELRFEQISKAFKILSK